MSKVIQMTQTMNTQVCLKLTLFGVNVFSVQLACFLLGRNGSINVSSTVSDEAKEHVVGEEVECQQCIYKDKGVGDGSDLKV